MDGLCVLNDGGEFGNSFLKIYTEELELNAEHQGNHACFLKLDTSVKNNIFAYKLFNKRDTFSFTILQMPHTGSNIPQNILYSTIKEKTLKTARSTLFYLNAYCNKYLILILLSLLTILYIFAM